jgi:hypothetical protein
MPKVMCILVSLRMIWPTARESTFISMEASTQVSSRTIYKMDMELRSGLMELVTKENTRTE